MNCPKCGKEMGVKQYSGIDYKQCVGCGGLWFDALEAEELSGIRGAATIDTGNLSQGEQMNKKWETSCPVCSVSMRVVHDLKYPEIQLDSCPSCHGLFFDAGEFKAFCGEDAFLKRVKVWSEKK